MNGHFVKVIDRIGGVDGFVDKAIEENQILIKKVFMVFECFMERVKGFDFVFKYKIDKLKQQLKGISFDEIRRQMIGLKTARESMHEIFFQDKLQTGIFIIDCKAIKEQLAEQIEKVIAGIIELLLIKIGKENSKLSDEINEVRQKMKNIPENLEELDELRAYCKDIDTTLEEINMKIKAIMNKQDLLEEMQYKISFEQFASSWSSFGFPLKVRKGAIKTLSSIENLEKTMAERLIGQQNDLDSDIIDINKIFDSLSKVDTLDNTDQVSVEFKETFMRIQNALVEADIINRREGILRQSKLTDYSSIETLKKSFLPFHKFWQYAQDCDYKYPQIMVSAIGSVDRDALTKDVMDTWTDLGKLASNEFKILPHMLRLTTILRKSYAELKPYLPVISDLKNPGLKSRHWKEIIDILGLETDHNNVTNLGFETFINKGVMDMKDEIRDISEIASKEMGFEKILNNIRNEWKNIRFEITGFRNTSYII